MSPRVLTFEPGMASLGTATVAIGVFDGVHLGHQALIQTCRSRAADLGTASVVVTFDRDPDRVVAPDRAALQLLELEDKVEALSALGIDAIVVVPFNAAVASMSPEAFVHEVLLAACRPLVVVVGEDFRFGRGASGDVTSLAAIGEHASFEVEPHPLVRVGGAPVTSTRIRSLVAGGQVAAAAQLLGRPHRLRGTVIRGRGIGARLGAPTANLLTHAYAATPAPGVYACWANLGFERHPAAVFVGKPLTLAQSQPGVEAHLIGYGSGPLYGREMALDFVDRLRDVERFEDERALAAAIAADIERVREKLGDAQHR
ncbi:MAG: riboflavin biosynthesis protein RibF [Coriobacteriia bacterium]|nr:riboflavin biosynthesis protein RibF [Coriobacteriia bacterium]